jgi:hypothetical protein
VQSFEAPYKGGISAKTEVTSVRLQQALGAYQVQLINPSTATGNLLLSKRLKYQDKY